MNGKNKHFMKSFTFLPYQVWPEQELWGSETSRTNLQEQKLGQREENSVTLFTTYRWACMSKVKLQSNEASWTFVLHH